MTDAEYQDWLRAIRRAAVLTARRYRTSPAARRRANLRAASKWSHR